MRKFAKLSAGIFSILAMSAFLARPATRWLIQSSEPRPSDLIVVLAGGAGERLVTGLQLYRAGLASRILITDGFGYPDLGMRYLRAGGVPERSLRQPLMPSESTYEDALAVRQVVVKDNIRSILVVTSPYHCRRTRLIFDRVLGDLGTDVTVTASVTLYMDMDTWWRTRQGWITVPGEFPKLIWSWLSVPHVSAVGVPRPPK